MIRKKNYHSASLDVAASLSLADAVAVAVVTGDFFGRPRFLAEPSLLAVVFGFAVDCFFAPADPDGRPRFLPDEAPFDDDGTVVAASFFGDVPDGLPRFFLAASSLF